MTNITKSNLSHRRKQNFENSKNQCLGKRDKSFRGQIDPRARAICGLINDKEEYYTTSSCAGRSFFYQGEGVKASTTFRRFRISHEPIQDSKRYFDLTTLLSDRTGGGDEIRSVGQFDHAGKILEMNEQDQNGGHAEAQKTEAMQAACELASISDEPIWLRFEPFILHVACRSLQAASALMNAARPSFKNVGLTTWKDDVSTASSTRNFAKYLIAIWGDEGLEMPLTTPDGSHPFAGNHQWLADLVNDRHQRNGDKINRFVHAVREMPASVDEEEEDGNLDGATTTNTRIPKSFDVLGDVAVLNTLPEGNAVELRQIGESIMKRNKAIKIVVARSCNLEGSERAPGSAGFVQLAGAIQRYPLMTSHAEYGIKCVIDLTNTFFSPRMGPERLRICQQVARGEKVLVLFAGVGMEALQIAGRTEATSVVAVEMNPIAVQCLRRSHQLLPRNKAVKCIGAEKRLEVIEGDVLRVLPEKFGKNKFDRVLAPRPKEGGMDGDLGHGSGGKEFLEALLPVMKPNGGECHWYDFAADHEFPVCSRTRQLLEGVCARQGLNMEVLHVANAGSVAMRQLRVCVDFRISPKNSS